MHDNASDYASKKQEMALQERAHVRQIHMKHDYFQKPSVLTLIHHITCVSHVILHVTSMFSCGVSYMLYVKYLEITF